LIGLLLCFLNAGSISNTLLLRPYQLQETALIVATYFCVLYHRKILDGAILDTWRDLTVLASIGALTLLSGYFSIAYGALLGGLVVCALIRQGRIKQIGFFVVVVVFSVGLAQTAYTNYLDGMIHSSRGTEALASLSPNEVASKFTESLTTFLTL